MPMPVSATDTSAISPSRRAPTSIRPPSSVNLRALDSRFRSTCFTFRSSPPIMPRRSSMVLPSRIPRRLARSRTRINAFSMAIGRSNSVSSSSMRPASIFERSRMSLMRERRCRPDSRMSWRYSVCFSLTSPNIFSARISENPMMAFSGVLELGTLVRDLPEEPGVLDGQYRLGSQSLERGDSLRRKGAPVPP